MSLISGKGVIGNWGMSDLANKAGIVVMVVMVTGLGVTEVICVIEGFGVICWTQ